MNSDYFEEQVIEHSLKPNNNLYNSNALAGEVGEVANAIKKLEIYATLKPEQRITIKTPEYYKNNIKEELGDILFYLTRICLDNNLTLSDISEHQINKLKEQDKFYNRIFLK